MQEKETGFAGEGKWHVNDVTLSDRRVASLPFALHQILLKYDSFLPAARVNTLIILAPKLFQALEAGISTKS